MFRKIFLFSVFLIVGFSDEYCRASYEHRGDPNYFDEESTDGPKNPPVPLDPFQANAYGVYVNSYLRNHGLVQSIERAKHTSQKPGWLDPETYCSRIPFHVFPASDVVTFGIQTLIRSFDQNNLLNMEFYRGLGISITAGDLADMVVEGVYAYAAGTTGIRTKNREGSDVQRMKPVFAILRLLVTRKIFEPIADKCVYAIAGYILPKFGINLGFNDHAGAKKNQQKDTLRNFVSKLFARGIYDTSVGYLVWTRYDGAWAKCGYGKGSSSAPHEYKSLKTVKP